MVNESSLRECFHLLKKDRAAGVDAVTFAEYEEHLGQNIEKLVESMKLMSYKPQPVRRMYVPKGNGKMRPLGIPVMEDKMVQMAFSSRSSG